ncbi:MAG: hypothetical protein JXA78_19940 [Anaerolineales bacterium]|nr:hypothetical protein [Anaerolineales bacterium]
MSLPRSAWRLMHTPPAGGAWNMALDEAILEAAGRGEAPPTLRLYAWSPPCLSLGYAQPAADALATELAARGWDLVRRPTGGRAILHTDELTYSVTGPQDEPRLAGGVLESYRLLAGALLHALRLLGISAQALEKPAGERSLDEAQDSARRGAHIKIQNPVCFEAPSNYEITVEAKKLIGSAQARRLQGVLQHGSLPLYGDLARITQVLVFPDPAARQQAARRLLARATTAQAILGEPLSWERAAQAIAQAFAETLNLDLQPAQAPTPAELQRAAELAQEKYTNPEWTERV